MISSTEFSRHVFVRSLIGTALVALSFQANAQTALPDLPPINEARIATYSKSYATRFALPMPASENELSGGIQAIHFSIERGPDYAPFYGCKLKVYLNSDLPIAYPKNGVSGTRLIVLQPEHFIFDNNVDNKRWLALSVEDRIHFSSQNSFNRLAGLASPGLDVRKHNGFWTGAQYDSFYRDLFPGITYLKLDVGCGLMQWGERYEFVQLWLERSGGKDYTKLVFEDPDDFLKFNIPSAFYKSTLKWAKIADTYNSALIAQRAKRRQEPN
jgi:hypothetical protein